MTDAINSTLKYLAGMLVLTAGLASSCSNAPEFDPSPQITASPSDNWFGIVSSDHAEIVIAGAAAQYASFKKVCSKVIALKGGMVDYPRRDIRLSAVQSDGATRISFARDYFQMDECAWELTGLVIKVSSPSLPQGVDFGVPAELIKPRTTLVYRCSPHQDGPPSCVLEGASKKPNAGALANASFLVSIAVSRD